MTVGGSGPLAVKPDVEAGKHVDAYAVRAHTTILIDQRHFVLPLDAAKQTTPSTAPTQPVPLSVYIGLDQTGGVQAETTDTASESGQGGQAPGASTRKGVQCGVGTSGWS